MSDYGDDYPDDGPFVWRDIRSAPKDGSRILLFYRFARRCHITEAKWVRGSGWTSLHDSGLRGTHWMPCPDDPPKPRKNGPIRTGLPSVAWGSLYF